MLIATAYITGYPIIVVNENFARCIKDQARKTGYNIEVYTVSEWRNIFACGAPRENVLIDEADGVIELAQNPGLYPIEWLVFLVGFEWIRARSSAGKLFRRILRGQGLRRQEPGRRHQLLLLQVAVRRRVPDRARRSSSGDDCRPPTRRRR